MKPLKIKLVLLVIFCFSCSAITASLKYPKDINKIKEVSLMRPDEESMGKFAQIKELTKDEIIELLETLDRSKSIGPVKFIPDFYIIFVQKNNRTRKIKINGNIIKDYDNDCAYKIYEPDFLKDF